MHRGTITTKFWHYRVYNSAWKVQFPISAWKMAVRVQMWRQTAKCSIGLPQQRGKRGHRSCYVLTQERPGLPSMPISVIVVKSRLQTHGKIRRRKAELASRGQHHQAVSYSFQIIEPVKFTESKENESETERHTSARRGRSMRAGLRREENPDEAESHT